jgi:NitT/TauT family transport system substrate-binding protein
MKKSLGFFGVAAAIALVMSGCTDSGAPSSAPGTSGAEEEFTVNVAALPIAETGAIWAAIEEGIFAEHGLTLNLLPAAGGAQAVPSLLSGDIDFAIGSPVSAIKAALAGEQVRLIGDYADGNPLGEKDANSVVAGAASGIESWSDLAGMKVGTNSPGAHGNLAILEAVKADGGDPSTVEFVIVQGGFPAMPALLESGELDAAWMPDPFRGMAVAAGGTEVGYPWQDGGLDEISGLANITIQSVIDENPQMVTQWVAALDEALAFAQENPDQVFQAIADNLDIPLEAAQATTLSTFNGTLDRERLEALIEAGIAYGSAPPYLFWDASPDLDELVVDVG